MNQYFETEFSGRVVWIGSVEDRGSSLRSKPQEQARLEFSGIGSESHGGLTRPACARVELLHETGTEIRNVRQVTIVSAEEMAMIADDIGLGSLSPSLVGANLVVEGIPNLTLVPPGSRLQFSSGATLTVDMRNLPCNLPAREIEFEAPGHGRAFKTAARNRRGITSWVEREGPVSIGDSIRLLVPGQPEWPELRSQRTIAGAE